MRLSGFRFQVSGLCFASILTIALLLAACDRRPLEVMEPQKAQLRLDVDWMTRYGQKPNGMTVMIWGDGWTKPFVSSSNNVESMRIELDPGHYRVIVMNKSFSEYGSMKFLNTDNFDEIVAKGTDITQYYNGSWDSDITYMPDPEMIGCAVDEFTVTEDMLLTQVNFYPYQEWIDAHRYADTRWYQEEDGVFSTTVTVRPETTRLNVWVRVKGLEYMRSMIGNISGMADGFLMSQYWRTTDERYMLFEREKWTFTTYTNPKGPGLLYYSLPVFGLAHGKEFVSQRTEENNVLTLYVTLVDGSTRTFTFNVGKEIVYKGLEDNINAQLEATLLLELLMELELELEIEIELPPVVPSSESSSGFDAHVDPWEDGGTVDVGF